MKRQKSQSSISKRGKVGEMMGEILDMADTEGVCPVCWVNHPDQTCPRQGTMDALMKTFHRMANEGRDDDVTEQQTLQEDAAKEEEALDDDITLEVPLTMPDTTADKAIDVEMVDPNASKPAEDEAETEGEPTVFPGIRPNRRRCPLHRNPPTNLLQPRHLHPRFGGAEELPPLGSSRESMPSQATNLQNIQQQAPQFLEYDSAKRINDAHFVIIDGDVEFVKGIPPCTGGARSQKVIEEFASMLQRKEDVQGNDYDYGGTSHYLKADEVGAADACLINPGQGINTRFFDGAYQRCGTYGYRECVFNNDEIYHIGKKLSIWLRHDFLKPWSRTPVDPAGWASVDDILYNDDFWWNVHMELARHGHGFRVDEGCRVCWDPDSMRAPQPTTDELFRNRSWGITLAIESELWNQRQKSGKKRMEITGVKLKRDVTQDAYKKLMSNQSC